MISPMNRFAGFLFLVNGLGVLGEPTEIFAGDFPLPRFAGRHVVIGSWIIGQQACGIGIREDSGPVTKDLSRFVPHVSLN